MDRIERLSRSVIQHGPYNDRIYLMKLAQDDAATVVPLLQQLAQEQGYSKIFAKVPAEQQAPFITAGFVKEAVVPGYFNGREDCLFLSRFLRPERQQEGHPELVSKSDDLSRAATLPEELPPLQEHETLRAATPDDVESMAALYRRVFPDYPFPIHDPGYLAETMADDSVAYYGIWREGAPVALSSAEMDHAAQAVEMTDFATLPDERGRSLAQRLLQHMEEAMRARSFRTAFTIARAYSPGMNITFGRAGYQNGGLLCNNTRIMNGLESMFVWSKPL